MPTGSPKFETPEEIQEKIDEYFEGGCRTIKVIVGRGRNKKEVIVKRPTISGLAYFLGFASRQSFYDYEKREAFSYTIKRARLFLEVYYEELLQEGNYTAAIFALQQFGWKNEKYHNVNDQRKKRSDVVESDLETAKKLSIILSAAKRRKDSEETEEDGPGKD